MGRTFIRQDAQIKNSAVYDDSGAAGSTLESGASSIEGDLNSLRAQVKRILDDSAGNWYDDIPTVNSKKRDLKDINTDLDDVEEHRFLFRTQVLTDITVPSDVKATSVLTASSQPNDGDTVTTGTKTYTFKTSLTDTDGYVLIGATASDSLDNLIAAITLDTPIGGRYAASTTANTFVTATAGAGDTVDVEALLGGTQGNLIATTENTSAARLSWTGTTLSGGTGDVVVLSVSGSEAPSLTAAVGAVTTEGAVVAYNSSFPNITLDEVAGPNAIRPDNLCVVRDSSDGTVIQASDGKDIWALIQSESNTDEHTFDDSSNQVMLSFVKENSAGNDLEQVDSADIAAASINYSYVRRLKFDSLPESAFLTGVWVDQIASADVTLDNAIDNQVGIATQVQDIDWDILDNYEFAFTADSGATDLIKISPTGGGNTLLINFDSLDVDLTNDADISQGIKVDTAGTEIDIGVTAGHVETTGSDDLHVNGAGELYLDDGNQTGSSWAQTDGIKLSDTTTEWDNFETVFGGEVSLLNAIAKAGKRGKTTGELTSNVAANTNVTGAGGSPNIDTQLGDYSGVTFVSDVDVYLNGELMEGGADAAANNDVYPGDTPANGDLKFEFGLESSPGNPDKITMIIYG
jgi:hypothetical protein